MHCSNPTNSYSYVKAPASHPLLRGETSSFSLRQSTCSPFRV